MCAHKYSHTLAFAHACTCAGQRLASGVYINCSLPKFLKLYFMFQCVQCAGRGAGCQFFHPGASAQR